jgi:hypothetical protein
MPSLPRDLVLAIRVVLWAGLAGMGWVAFSLAIGVTDPYPTAVVQAIAPVVMAPAVPLAIIAGWRRWWVMFPMASLVVLMEAIILLSVIVAPGPPAVRAGAPRLSVRFANLLFGDQDRASTWWPWSSCIPTN